MTMYQIKTESGRPVAGIFIPINNLDIAERIKAEWQHNYPCTNFVISEVTQ